MKLRTMLMIATATGAMALAPGAPTLAAPLAPAQLSPEQPATVQQVQYRRWHGGPGWHHRPHGYYGHRHHGGGAAVLGGLAAGAIIGGAIASSQARANNDAYCAQRFRSYDPGSGTYLGYDGARHPCP